MKPMVLTHWFDWRRDVERTEDNRGVIVKRNAICLKTHSRMIRQRGCINVDAETVPRIYCIWD